MRLSRDVTFLLNISNTCFGVDDDVSTFKLPLSDLMEEVSFSSNDIFFANRVCDFLVTTSNGIQSLRKIDSPLGSFSTYDRNRRSSLDLTSYVA